MPLPTHKPRYFFVTSAIAMALPMFAAGWLGYPVLLALITAGIDVRLNINTLADQATHQGAVSMAFSLLGAVTYAGCAYGRSLITAFAVIGIALFSSMIWMWVLRENFLHVAPALTGEMMLPLEAIPLYQVGLVGSAAVTAFVALLFSWRHIRQASTSASRPQDPLRN